MTSSDICKLLATKHDGDIFVPQCKTGSTWMGQYRIMDAWTMKRSYAKPLSICYEIKVSRSDFLGDRKWQDYLPYCNELYFVCPPNLIAASELPPEAGLMWASANCARLYTKKKATYRTVDIPDSLFRYILFSRSKVAAEMPPDNKLEYWQRWMEHKKFTEEFGYSVSRAIRETVEKEIDEVRRENCRLQGEINQLETVKEFCEENNVPMDKWNLKKWLATQTSDIPAEVHDALVKIADIVHDAQRIMGRRIA